jgi:magnesium transporter
MEIYNLDAALTALGTDAAPVGNALLLLTSTELEQRPMVPGLADVLCHVPTARDGRICKAEFCKDFLSGTIATPRHAKNQIPITIGYLLTSGWVVLCDDSGAVHGMLSRLRRETPDTIRSTDGFFSEFLELLTAKDLRHLQSLEDNLEKLEEQVLSDQMEGFNAQMSPLRKEITRWSRYYTQLADMICELQENSNGYFSDQTLRTLHLVENHVNRLQNEAQALREYALQVRELFQSEIDVHQNSIMKVLTIVATIFLPLSLVVGWYGMNFTHMPELSWRYGYPAVIAASVLVVLLSLWLMKRKKFW